MTRTENTAMNYYSFLRPSMVFYVWKFKFRFFTIFTKNASVSLNMKKVWIWWKILYQQILWINLYPNLNILNKISFLLNFFKFILYIGLFAEAERMTYKRNLWSLIRNLSEEIMKLIKLSLWVAHMCSARITRFLWKPTQKAYFILGDKASWFY